MTLFVYVIDACNLQCFIVNKVKLKLTTRSYSITRYGVRLSVRPFIKLCVMLNTISSLLHLMMNC